MFENFYPALIARDTGTLDLLMATAARTGRPPHLLRDAVDNTLMHAAANNRRVREWLDALVLLRKSDATVTTELVTARDRLGRTALHVAASAGDVDGVCLLIATGSDVNAVDHMGLTPLDHAQARAREDVAGSLQAAGARTSDASGERPLHGDRMPAIVEAMYNPGNEWKHLIRKAIADQVPLERLRYRGGHLLHVAAEEGLADECLIELGTRPANALVNEPNDHGERPLHLAAFWGHPPSVRALIDAGADVHALGRGGASAMHCAARHNCVEAAEMLMAAGAPFDTVDADGCTPLDLAIRNGHLEGMAVLLERALAAAGIGSGGRATAPGLAPAAVAADAPASPRHWQEVLRDAPSATSRAASVSPRSVQPLSPMA